MVAVEMVALPIVADGRVLRVQVPMPFVVLPPAAREVLRRKVAANDAPAAHPPAAA